MKKENMYHDGSMWKGATKGTFIKAQILRENMTEAEKKLWDKLSKNKLKGYKFRRQHPILYYIADFYCHEVRLIIEIDGGYHNTEEQDTKDKERTEDLKSNGLTVIRFKNESILNKIEDVIKQISETIDILEQNK